MGSPYGAEGPSSRLAAAFLESYRAAHPSDTIDTLDVWSEDLPPFANDAVGGKLNAMSGQATSPAESAAFEPVMPFITRLKSADKVVLACGM